MEVNTEPPQSTARQEQSDFELNRYEKEKQKKTYKIVPMKIENLLRNYFHFPTTNMFD